MSTSKLQHGSARDPNKQQNSMQYLTYYQNEYNRDKSNTTNNYSSNTGDRGEQQRCNRNARQDNSNNAINLQRANNNYESNESAKTGDIIIEVLTSISLRTPSTETALVPRVNSFLVNSPSQ